MGTVLTEDTAGLFSMLFIPGSQGCGNDPSPAPAVGPGPSPSHDLDFEAPAVSVLWADYTGEDGGSGMRDSPGTLPS